MGEHSLGLSQVGKQRLETEGEKRNWEREESIGLNPMTRKKAI